MPDTLLTDAEIENCYDVEFIPDYEPSDVQVREFYDQTLITAQDAKTVRYYQAELDAASANSEHWESNCAKACDESDALREKGQALADAAKMVFDFERANGPHPWPESLKKFKTALEAWNKGE